MLGGALTDKLLSGHALGLQIEALQTEKEGLCDAVLLAGSINQIVDIWDRVTSLITGQSAVAAQEELFSQDGSEDADMAEDDDFDDE